MKLIYPPGATPIDPNEFEGLIPDHISTQKDLNAWEAANIAKARLWLQRKKLTNEHILTSNFIHKLHKKMFDKTWRWAGNYRNSQKNIGVDTHLVGNEMAKFIDDIKYWMKNETFDLDEIATRAHHLLTKIHPFPNGNGRFAREYTDVLLKVNGRQPFTWGSTYETENHRDKYIQALRKADSHDYSELLKFVRS